MTETSGSVVRTLAEVAQALDAEVVGDGDLPVRTVTHPALLSDATELAFIMDPGALPALDGRPVRAAVVAGDIDLPEGRFDGHIAVDNPRYALAILLDLFDRPLVAPAGVHPAAVVEPDAVLADGVSVGPLAWIGRDATVGAGSVIMPHVSIGAGARIGGGCILHPGVRVGERVVLGDRVIVQQNASLGADGFSYVTPGLASFEQPRQFDKVTVRNEGIRRINSIGTVILGDDVEIGACATVDRSNLGATVIGNNTKIDNLVTVAHNCRIGSDCLISGQTGISGSCTIGDRVVIAGQSGIADHIRIGDDVLVGAGSAVIRDVDDKQIVAGYPARPKDETVSREINIGRLGRIIRDLSETKKRIAALESDPAGGVGSRRNSDR